MVHRHLTAFSLVAAASAQGPYPFPNPANSVLLSDYVNTTGARCLDGTPQRYWIAKSTSVANSTKWYMHFMGGGWCESTADCAGRAYSLSQCHIGSSRPECLNSTLMPGNSIPGVTYNETMDYRDIPSVLNARWGGGLLNNDPSVNPLTYDWNRVEISYCSGESYTGALPFSVNTTYNGDNVQLYYRGRVNLDAILDSLLKTQGMASATELIVSGDSAGGLATFWHTDYIAAALADTGVHVVGVPDSGFFYADPTYQPWNASLRWVVQNSNGYGGLPQACVASRAWTGGQVSDCAFPEVASQFTLSPTFVMNSRFDSALDSISGGENGKNVSNVNRMGALVLSLLNASALNPVHAGNAAFITACHEHCGQWAQGQVLGPGNEYADFNVTIIREDGAWQAVPAVQAWYNWLVSPSTYPLDHPSARVQKRTVHDDLVWLRAQLLQRELQAQGMTWEAARAAVPAWATRAGPLAALGQDGQAATAHGMHAHYVSMAQQWIWLQPALYPCSTCCQGGQQ